MSVLKLLKYSYLAYFSKPKADRLLYRTIKKNCPKTILEIGIGTGQRTCRLLEQVLEQRPAEEVRYAGIDLFEARTPGTPGMAFKQAHAAFKPFGVKTQLVPGDPFSALARTANVLLNTDLVIISADQDSESLTRAWMYFPRMLHEGSRIFREEKAEKEGETVFRLVERSEIDALATASQRSSRRAA